MENYQIIPALLHDARLESLEFDDWVQFALCAPGWMGYQVKGENEATFDRDG